MIVYKTLNTRNGKYYIGMDTKNNPDYIGSGTLLKQAIRKYGKESFKKIILEECTTVEELKEKEKYWIAIYDACSDRGSYNISTGGIGGDNFTFNPNKEQIREKLQARRHTKETRKKISENNHQSKYGGSRVGTQWTEEQRSRMETYHRENGGSFKGKKHTEKTKQIIRENHLGKKASEETKVKMSLAKKGTVHKKQICPHCKKEGGGNAMYQWHFNNCKYKENE